ncbi:siderophore ABC transporter substrate-binding protein [Propionibacteriaceae bacterium G1746]|uniref:siderophore ABC transporter substrate-binding protein n=1 Tax=Aestuariimicrobium sp. G57 TaxID=3418485 RepID=UPI003C1561A3
MPLFDQMPLFDRPLTRRRLGLVAASIAAVGTLAACGASAEAGSSNGPKVSVTHAQGTTEVAQNPQKIVVLDFGALDTLNSLGLADRVVGIPKGGVVPESLAAFKDDKYADVGTLQEPNIEAINKLKPDLVIAGFRSAAKYPELAKHFTTIDITYTTDKPFYDGVSGAATIIGKAVGKDAEVATKLAEIKKALADAKAKAPTGAKGMILMTTAGKATLHGADSRYGMIHRDLGIAQAITDVKAASHGDAVSFEAVQKADPDLLFVIDRDAAVGQEGKAAKEVLDNELVATTKAWKNNKVTYLDGQRWYITIHGLDNALAMVAEAAASL